MLSAARFLDVFFACGASACASTAIEVLAATKLDAHCRVSWSMFVC